MPTTKHKIVVGPSRWHQILLLVGHLLLCWPMWSLLHGAYWLWFVLALGISLAVSLYQAHHRQLWLELSGQELHYQGQWYRLGQGSRVGPGFLWLDLEGEQVIRLWIFADSLAPADFRLLARQVNLR